MRAICCAILALVMAEVVKLKMSGSTVTQGDVKVAMRMILVEWIFMAIAVVLCVLGL